MHNAHTYRAYVYGQSLCSCRLFYYIYNSVDTQLQTTDIALVLSNKIAYLLPVPRSKIRGALLSLPNKPSRRVGQ